MTRSSNWFICLTLLTLTTAYAVFTGGADDPGSFATTIALLGLAGIAGGLFLFQAGPTARADRHINLAAFAFLLYVAFQLIPLPIALLRVVSPTRADIAEALSSITGAIHYAPLSIAPPTTWVHLSRVCGYALAFFVARQLVRRSPFGAWTAIIPLVVVAAAQAGWALLTHEGDAMALVSGSYPNRNHFAGLLEMTLPLTIGYSLSVLYRSGRRGVLAMTDVAKAIVPLAMALLLFTSILLSSSKGGAVACLLSLFFMAAVWLGRGMPQSRRWPFLALLTLLLLVVFVFLTPSHLVERFGQVATTQDSEGRVPIWQDTLHLIADYPLFGAGFGAFFPAFLRYQFAGIGLAWTNTHNDYLQLLSELGIVGFLAPAVLLISLFGRAVNAASEPEASEGRFIGLACAGGMLAILIHSLTDFNTYVTANGLVLAWMCGVAATLGQPVAESYTPQTTAARRGGYALALAVLAIGVLTAGYGFAWQQYLRNYQTNADAERRFCRYGVCDTQGVLSSMLTAKRQAAPGEPANELVTLDPAVYLAYLDRDRAAPYRWDELGSALFKAGRRDEARQVFARAITLGPTSASTLLMASEFAFDDGREAEGLALASRALAAHDTQMYDAVFTMLSDKHVPVTRIVSSAQLDRNAGVALFHRLLGAEPFDFDAVSCVWVWAVDSGFADNQLTREYTDALLARGRASKAWSGWLRYAGTLGEDGYPSKNAIFNSRFEREPTGVAFDWRILPSKGVTAVVTKHPTGGSGKTLRLTFDGTANVTDVGVSQQFFLVPGHYDFRAMLRSEGLTTDQGVGIRITSAAETGAVDVMTEAVRGSTEWVETQAEFDVVGSGGVVTMRLMRRESLKFDSLVRGTVWVEQARAIRALWR